MLLGPDYEMKKNGLREYIHNKEAKGVEEVLEELREAMRNCEFEKKEKERIREVPKKKKRGRTKLYRKSGDLSRHVRQVWEQKGPWQKKEPRTGISTGTPGHGTLAPAGKVMGIL